MAMDINSSGDLFAVSGLKQAGTPPIEGNPAVLSKLILFDEASQINVQQTRETNQGEKTGYVEPTEVSVLSADSSGTLTQTKVTPDALAWAASFGLGSRVTTEIDAGLSYRHIMALTNYPTNPAYFTAAHRRGGSGGAAADFRRHYALGVNTMQLKAAQNDFMSMALGVLGIGKTDDSIVTEHLTALDNATSLPAIANDPVGANDTERAENLTVWADMDDDGIYERQAIVTGYTAASNIIAISSLGGAGVSIPYRVTYQSVPTGDFAWADLASLTTPEEFFLKAANLQIFLGTAFSSFAPLTKGVTGQVSLCEVKDFQWDLDWQGSTGKCWRIGSVASDSSTQVQLGSALQKLTVNREVRDYLFKQNYDENTALGFYFDAIGPNIPGTSTPYSVKFAIPRLKFLTKDFQVTDGKWVEAGGLVVLKDPNNPTNPTVQIEVVNGILGTTYLTNT